MIKKFLIFFSLLFAAYADSFVSAGYRGSFEYSFVKRLTLNTSLAILESEGDIENLRNIFKSPSVSLGVVQKDILEDLIADDERAKEDLVVLSPLYEAAIVIVAPKTSFVDSLKSLSNLRVVTDLKGSGSYYTLLKLQEIYMINPEIYRMKISQGLEYLKKGRADALFFVGDISKIAKYGKFFKFVPVILPSYGVKTFSYGKNGSLKTSYVDKFLVSSSKKIKLISKGEIRTILQALLDLKKSERDYFCGYDLSKLDMNAKTYIYFVCSENVGKGGSLSEKAPNEKNKRAIVEKDVYYDNIEDIVIYPKALKNRNFVGMSTSYIIEKTKLDNAVKLFKNELREDPSSKVFIISRGEEYEAIKNADMVYRFFKKAGVPRSNILKKISPLQNSCPDEECEFKNTVIRFKTL